MRREEKKGHEGALDGSEGVCLGSSITIWFYGGGGYSRNWACNWRDLGRAAPISWAR